MRVPPHAGHVVPRRRRRSGPVMARSSRWDALLFDLDGTLADSIELILRSFRHTMQVHRGTVPPDSVWLASLGTPLREQLRAFARSDEELEAMVETYVEYQRSVHDEMVRAYPGVTDMLEAVARAGLRLAVVTGKRREMAARTLRVCGLDRFFSVVITADDAVPGKPDAAPVRAAATALGIARSDRILFTGDSPHDIAAGRAAGVRTAAALWGARERDTLLAAAPDYRVETIPELTALALG
nr:MAG: HAD family hydrolase [bacterium]